jgi:pyrimidine operon attenuation protein/uracil phosphoribosyltransferase
VPKSERIEAPEVHAAVEKVAARIARAHKDTPEFVILGIANGGLEFAKRLTRLVSSRLRREIPSGVIDISFYRDDIGTRPIPKVFSPTDIPGKIDDSVFILADDVFQSGRTIRAALEELFAQGRPAQVDLAVLVDRGRRTLPIRPDHVGITVDLPGHANVRVKLDPRDEGRDEIRFELPRKP